MLRLSKYKLKLIREAVNIQLLRNLYSEKEVETAREIIRDITNELQEVNVYERTMEGYQRVWGPLSSE